MRTLLISAFVAVLYLISCQNQPAPATQKMTGLAGGLQDSTIIRVWPHEIDSLRKIDPNIPFIDVRSETEFRNAHIYKAMNCDMSSPDFSKRILRLSVESPVILYDTDSSLSLKAAETMKELGFKRIYEMAGGIYSWAREGKTLVTGESKIDSSIILR